MPAAPPSLGLLADTWRALARPRRLVPIGLVGLPLVAAQWWFTRDASATVVAIAMLTSFLALAPASWRILFPLGRPAPASALRVLGYALIGVVAIGLTGVVLPRATGLLGSYLTVDPSLAIMLGMFWVGGWGLGRDIDLEAQVERERARAAALEVEKERAQLLALKSHLDPHFLFNTINAIAEWCQEDPAVAEAALLRLATMLRTMLSALEAPRWRLAEELALLDDLLGLHAVRDPERFTVERRGWDAAPDLPVPPMLLLPLVENAMKHGPAAGHRGSVLLGVEVLSECVRIRVDNPGPYAGPRPGGQGVEMVRRRLRLTWGAAARLRLAGTDGRTCATLDVPLDATETR